MELILTGDVISAREAEKLGLVNVVVPDDKFEEEVEKFLKRLTEKSGIVLRITKRAILASLNVDFETALQNNELIYKYALMKTHDANEGLEAFVQKRQPQWKNE